VISQTSRGKEVAKCDVSVNKGKDISATLKRVFKKPGMKTGYGSYGNM